jgi:phage terminase large subunit-like protein
MDPLDEVREIIRHLEIRKRINPLEFFERLPKQDQFHKCPDKVKGIFGGNRSGKSEEGAEYVIQKCLAKPKQRWWAVAETEEVSINIQQRKLWELLPKTELKYAHYDEVNGFRNAKIVFKNGSSIKFKTYKQGREAFASDDLDGIWNDEEPQIEICKEQRMRLIDRDGEMIFTMTSLNGITELMHELFEDHEVLESQYSPLVQEELPRVVKKNSATFFMLWSTENPHINQARLAEEIKFMTRQEIKSRILGIPSNLSGKIYPNFQKRIHVVPDDYIPKKHVTIYHVLDPHDRKPWAMQWWAVDKTGRAFCIREYPWNKNFNEMEFDDKTYKDYVAAIREVEYEIIEEYGRSVSKRIIDPNFGNATERKAEREGGQSKTTPKTELKKLGLHFIDGIDALEAGHLQVRKWLHYEEKDGELVVKPKLFISERCENTIRHLSRYSRKDLDTADGDVKDKAKPMDKYKDFCDDARYFVMSNPHYIDRFAPEPVEAKKIY